MKSFGNARPFNNTSRWWHYLLHEVKLRTDVMEAANKNAIDVTILS